MFHIEIYSQVFVHGNSISFENEVSFLVLLETYCQDLHLLDFWGSCIYCYKEEVSQKLVKKYRIKICDQEACLLEYNDKIVKNLS